MILMALLLQSKLQNRLTLVDVGVNKLSINKEQKADKSILIAHYSLLITSAPRH